MARKMGKKCVTLTTGTGWDAGDTSKLVGRAVTFKICRIRGAIHIQRLGRRGGARRSEATRGGVTACNPAGQSSKCIRGQGMIVYAGGGGKLRRRGIEVFNGR